MSDGGNPDISGLLVRHLPLLRYDSAEQFFATSVTAGTANAGSELQRAEGAMLATAEPTHAQTHLSLGLLGSHRCANAQPTRRQVRIAASGTDARTRARRLQDRPEHANRVYGHAATGSDGRVWLSYWFFYLYNDYTLIGPYVGAGRHEGDWEMIQLRLDAASVVPDLALYTQHQQVEARDWEGVGRIGDRPVICVARGCHACYYSPGLYWTGVWFDRADGRGPSPALELEVITDHDPSSAWAHWPGRWGGTEPGNGIGKLLGLDASSPHGPGHQRQWRDPAKLLASVKPRRRSRLRFGR